MDALNSIKDAAASQIPSFPSGKKDLNHREKHSFFYFFVGAATFTLVIVAAFLKQTRAHDASWKAEVQCISALGLASFIYLVTSITLKTRIDNPYIFGAIIIAMLGGIAVSIAFFVLALKIPSSPTRAICTLTSLLAIVANIGGFVHLKNLLPSKKLD